MSSIKQIRRIISIVIYGLVSIVIALIIIRLFMLLIGANKTTSIVSFINNSSETFVTSFRGIYPDIMINNGQFGIEVFSVVALMFYVSLAFLISKSIRSVVETDVIQIVVNLIDTVFKFAEFILITRFIFKLTGASIVSQFVSLIYDISNIIYEPFKGILPGFSIPSINAVFETSTLIAIIVIIVFDVLTEGVIAHLKADADANGSGLSTPPAPKTINRVVEKYASPTNNSTSPNITINIPQQNQPPLQQVIPPTQYIDRRTVQVINPQMPPSNPNQQNIYPYYGQNDLEHQRPAPRQQLQGQGYYTPINNEPLAPRNANPNSGNS